MEPSLLGALMVQAFPSPLVDVICESSQRGLIKVGIAVVIANLERGESPQGCVFFYWLSIHPPTFPCSVGFEQLEYYVGHKSPAKLLVSTDKVIEMPSK